MLQNIIISIKTYTKKVICSIKKTILQLIEFDNLIKKFEKNVKKYRTAINNANY